MKQAFKVVYDASQEHNCYRGLPDPKGMELGTVVECACGRQYVTYLCHKFMEWKRKWIKVRVS